MLWKVIVHGHADLFFLLSSMEFCVRFILKTDLPTVALPCKKSTLKMTGESTVPVVCGTLDRLDPDTGGGSVAIPARLFLLSAGGVREGRWQCVAMLPRNKKKRFREGPCFAPLAKMQKASVFHTGISYLALVP